MKVLVINSGSSSVKYMLFDMESKAVLTKGLVERIGEMNAVITHTMIGNDREKKTSLELPIENHTAALKKVVELLTSPETGSIKDTSEIEAVGHRVVHGGETYQQAVIVDEAVKANIRALIPLAPLHNGPNLQGIEVAEQIFTEAKQVAVFDTAFHQTMPPKSYRYPLPKKLYEEEKIRAYGMHGTSHQYVSKKMLELLDKPVEETSIITVHLGNGCSMAAIKGGKCLDTSMGLSPLAGLMMGTRTGDIDPSIPFFLGTKLGMSFEEVDTLLNKQSGLKGIAGSNDMRDVMGLRAKGDPDAILAIEMYTQRIKKYIGAYAAELGSLDAIVFTAGIGENVHVIRDHACAGLDFFGVKLDQQKNQLRSENAREVHAEDSKVQVWVIPTNEELEIAQQAEALV